jgi:hypothetical protein
MQHTPIHDPARHLQNVTGSHFRRNPPFFARSNLTAGFGGCEVAYSLKPAESRQNVRM